MKTCRFSQVLTYTEARAILYLALARIPYFFQYMIKVYEFFSNLKVEYYYTRNKIFYRETRYTNLLRYPLQLLLGYIEISEIRFCRILNTQLTY